ncbi:MAG: N-acetylmuramoyl-L-alanine amidase [Spirochaetaceae bacterium]|nr:N-acetylmuramoyl-L-alanine amidase [Spirochaetaceae bacterium]HPE88271.1 N-acetylmuramoyl-L-alanine amidase [Spirochaetales bacterium]
MTTRRSPLASLLLALVATVAAAAVGAQGSGDQWLDLMEVAARWKANVSYDPLTGTGHVLRGSDLVRFKVDYPVFSVGQGTALRATAIKDAGTRLGIRTDAVHAIEAWFAERDAERASHFSVAAILIDPGHGGKDPGAIGEFGSGKDRLRVAEKDVVLAIGREVYDRLVERWPDKRILISRGGDTFPTLDERVEMANDVQLGINEAIIYVSIHANASFNKAASGFEVWYLNPEYRRSVVDPKKAEGVDEHVLPILNAMLEEEYTTESVFLAKGILGGLDRGVGDVSVNRGLRAEEWFVVRNAKMPSVLVEVGFVTNEDEAKRLSDPDHLRKLGDGIYNGIVEFVDYFEHRKGSSAQ